MNDGYILLEIRYHAILYGMLNPRADWTIQIQTISIILGEEEQVLSSFQDKLNTLYLNKLSDISDCKLHRRSKSSYTTKEFYVQSHDPPELRGHDGFFYRYYAVPISSSGIQFI
jgi:hypothetical protein